MGETPNPLTRSVKKNKIISWVKQDRNEDDVCRRAIAWFFAGECKKKLHADVESGKRKEEVLAKRQQFIDEQNRGEEHVREANVSTYNDSRMGSREYLGFAWRFELYIKHISPDIPKDKCISIWRKGVKIDCVHVTDYNIRPVAGVIELWDDDMQGVRKVMEVDSAKAGGIEAVKKCYNILEKNYTTTVKVGEDGGATLSGSVSVLKKRHKDGDHGIDLAHLSNFFTRLKGATISAEPAVEELSSDAAGEESATPQKGKPKAKAKPKQTGGIKRELDQSSDTSSRTNKRGRPGGMTETVRIKNLGIVRSLLTQAESLKLTLGTEEGLQKTTPKIFSAMREKLVAKQDPKLQQMFEEVDQGKEVLAFKPAETLRCLTELTGWFGNHEAVVVALSGVTDAAELLTELKAARALNGGALGISIACYKHTFLAAVRERATMAADGDSISNCVALFVRDSGEELGVALLKTGIREEDDVEEHLYLAMLVALGVFLDVVQEHIEAFNGIEGEKAAMVSNLGPLLQFATESEKELGKCAATKTLVMMRHLVLLVSLNEIVPCEDLRKSIEFFKVTSCKTMKKMATHAAFKEIVKHSSSHLAGMSERRKSDETVASAVKESAKVNPTEIATSLQQAGSKGQVQNALKPATQLLKTIVDVISSRPEEDDASDGSCTKPLMDKINEVREHVLSTRLTKCVTELEPYEALFDDAQGKTVEIRKIGTSAKSALSCFADHGLHIHENDSVADLLLHQSYFDLVDKLENFVAAAPRSYFNKLANSIVAILLNDQFVSFWSQAPSLQALRTKIIGAIASAVAKKLEAIFAATGDGMVQFIDGKSSLPSLPLCDDDTADATLSFAKVVIEKAYLRICNDARCKGFGIFTEAGASNSKNCPIYVGIVAAVIWKPANCLTELARLRDNASLIKNDSDAITDLCKGFVLSRQSIEDIDEAERLIGMMEQGSRGKGAIAMLKTQRDGIMKQQCLFVHGRYLAMTTAIEKEAQKTKDFEKMIEEKEIVDLAWIKEEFSELCSTKKLTSFTATFTRFLPCEKKLDKFITGIMDLMGADSKALLDLKSLYSNLAVGRAIDRFAYATALNAITKPLKDTDTPQQQAKGIMKRQQVYSRLKPKFKLILEKVSTGEMTLTA